MDISSWRYIADFLKTRYFWWKFLNRNLWFSKALKQSKTFLNLLNMFASENELKASEQNTWGFQLKKSLPDQLLKSARKRYDFYFRTEVYVKQFYCILYIVLQPWVEFRDFLSSPFNPYTWIFGTVTERNFWKKIPEKSPKKLIVMVQRARWRSRVLDFFPGFTDKG